MNKGMSALMGFFVALLVAYSTIFVVDQRSYAIVFAFGEVRNVVTEPGLHFKLPRPFQVVEFLDRRILTLSIDSNNRERFITAEKKNVQIDTFVKWQIADPKRYYVSFIGEERRAESRLAQIVRGALNDEITKHTVKDVISNERARIMDAVKKRVADESKQIGISIVDVRLKRVDFAEEINAAVYERMKAERARKAKEQRSTGSAESEQIRADADKQRTVILAEANRKAEEIKGEGDADASRIYAQAFGQNPEFYRFYRSLDAYKASFKNKSDILVLDPNSEFFKYFKNPGGAVNAAPAAKNK